MNSEEIIFKYFPHLSEDQNMKMRKLGEVYSIYNEQVNLISRKDIVNLYEHHILHSLAIGKVVDFGENKKVIDVGSGGGLPGIPLAILFPQTNFVLVDSINKKINTVNSIIHDLGLHNVTTKCERIEKVKDKFDYVIGRGVCCFDKFVALTKHLKDSKTKIFYLNGNNDETKTKHKIFIINDFFDEEFFQGKMIRSL